MSEVRRSGALLDNFIELDLSRNNLQFQLLLLRNIPACYILVLYIQRPYTSDMAAMPIYTYSISSKLFLRIFLNRFSNLRLAL